MMSDGPKLLLIDGNNMAHRVFWANQNLAHKGRSTGLIYGFFKQLISLNNRCPDHFRVIAWDAKGGSYRRVEESKAGVEAGIVPEHYKQSRKEQKRTPEMEADIESLFEQMDQVRDGLALTSTLQVTMEGVEGDDILYSYAKWAEEHDGESIIISTDQDFYQCLSDKTTIFDAMKKETWTPERFRLEFGFGPELWVDAGAIMGEVGPSKDNIFGVNKWGPKTTYKYVREHGGVDAIRAALEQKAKITKTEQNFLNSRERLRLALSLKQMDKVPNIPRTRVIHKPNPKDIESFFLRFGMASLLKDIWRFA